MVGGQWKGREEKFSPLVGGVQEYVRYGERGEGIGEGKNLDADPVRIL